MWRRGYLPSSRLALLRQWRRVVAALVDAVGERYPEAEVYLVGGAAEGRLTVLSDIDVAIVFPERLRGGERAEVIAGLWEELERRGVPSYYPLHIIVLSRGELERLKGAKKRLR